MGAKLGRHPGNPYASGTENGVRFTFRRGGWGPKTGQVNFLKDAGRVQASSPRR